MFFAFCPCSLPQFLKSLSRHENSVTHLSAGGYGGHRVVLVKVGLAFRVFQSNHSLDVATDRFTCLQWLASDYPWSRTLGLGEVVAFLAKFEEARRGSRAVWEELFTQGRRAMGLFDVVGGQSTPCRTAHIGRAPRRLGCDDDGGLQRAHSNPLLLSSLFAAFCCAECRATSGSRSR